MLNGVFSYVFSRPISTVRRFSRWQVSCARQREYQLFSKFSMVSVLSVFSKFVLLLNANRNGLDRFWLPRKVRFSTDCKVFVLVPTAVLRPTKKMETTAEVQLPVLRPKTYICQYQQRSFDRKKTNRQKKSLRRTPTGPDAYAGIVDPAPGAGNNS